MVLPGDSKSLQNKVREDGRIFGGEEWQEKVYNREEWKLLRTAINYRILHTPMERNCAVYNIVGFSITLFLVIEGLFQQLHLRKF
jgi:hypothetical protein